MDLNVFARGLGQLVGASPERLGSLVRDRRCRRRGHQLHRSRCVLRHRARRRAHPARIEPRQPQVLRAWRLFRGVICPTTGRATSSPTTFAAIRVCRFILSDDGSAFSSREQPELIKTTHGAFRPIDVKMGPDGAIYIADWYNPIIQHGEVDFRDPRRDHTHGPHLASHRQGSPSRREAQPARRQR